MRKVRKNVLLSKFSNYKIGGPARYFFIAQNVEEVKEAVLWTRRNKQKIFILGGGTNLLFGDRGFKGLVLKPEIKFLELEKTIVKVGAGVLMPDLLRFTIKHSLSGLEWAGGLPGTLGGAIRGNAGAFRGEIKDCVESVTSLNIETLKASIYSNKSCQFAYRSSFFKKRNDREIILNAALKLKMGNLKEIKAAIQDKIEFRNSRHPLEYPNSGSVFKNVNVKRVPKKVLAAMKHVIKPDPFPVIPTAYLISEAGLKGVQKGGAMISPKHPNFIVNINRAKAKDVLTLIHLVKSTLKRKFRITVEEEVQIVN